MTASAFAAFAKSRATHQFSQKNPCLGERWMSERTTTSVMTVFTFVACASIDIRMTRFGRRFSTWFRVSSPKHCRGKTPCRATTRHRKQAQELNGQRWLTKKLHAIGLPSRTQRQHRVRCHDGDRSRPVSKALLMITVSAALFTVSGVLWALVYLMALAPAAHRCISLNREKGAFSLTALRREGAKEDQHLPLPCGTEARHQGGDEPTSGAKRCAPARRSAASRELRAITMHTDWVCKLLHERAHWRSVQGTGRGCSSGVEHHVPNVGVMGSNPVARSNDRRDVPSARIATPPAPIRGLLAEARGRAQPSL